MTDIAPNAGSDSNQDSSYTVVARRYRPKSFADLVGQSNVATALATAIESSRVGHAYLFTGARGVGKTSTARIFAKALNNPDGPSASPDLTSDVAQAIDAGEDIDVIEIDGASNRGIDEIRQLRANVSVRPSRSRFKIYIIDEVHMLTSQAFNALLKTLEEPPEHVKFLFCTTDPDKIPITVLSRCQRFDFPPVQTVEIQARLKQICESENAEATDEALLLIAKRAAGSMRDSQSLLEQIISFSAGKIDVEQIHKILGSADDAMLIEIVSTAVNSDVAVAITKISSAVSEGVDPGQLAEQLLGLLRDTMLIATGASESLVSTADQSSIQHLKTLSESWGIRTILAAIQLLDETLVRMKSSVHAQVLLEVAVVEMCHLQDLESITKLMGHLSSDVDTAPRTNSPAQKKNDEIETSATNSAAYPTAPESNNDNPVSRGLENTVTSEPLSPSIQVESAPALESGTAQAAKSSSTENHEPSGPIGSTTESNSEPRNQTSTSESLPSKSATVDTADTQSHPTALSESTVSAAAQSNDARSNGVARTTENAVQSAIEQETSDGMSSDAPSNNNASTPAIQDSVADSSQKPAILKQWNKAISNLNELFAEYAQTAVAVEIKPNGDWEVAFPAGYEAAKQQCERPEALQKLTRALSDYLQSPTQITFKIDSSVRAIEPPTRAANDAQLAQQRVRQASQEPIIQLFKETFKCSITQVDPPKSLNSSPKEPSPGQNARAHSGS